MAFEFRHETWRDDEVYEALRARNAALVCADTEESGEAGAPIVPTADWGYLRLRRCDYDDQALGRGPSASAPSPGSGPSSSSSTRRASRSAGRRSSASSSGGSGAEPASRLLRSV